MEVAKIYSHARDRLLIWIRICTFTCWRYFLEVTMLYTILVLLLLFWLLGLLGGVGGGLIHLLLVIAVVAVVFQLVTGRRAL